MRSTGVEWKINELSIFKTMYSTPKAKHNPMVPIMKKSNIILENSNSFRVSF